MKATLILADYARVSEGKLDVLGAGWTVAGPDEVTMGLGVLVEVPWDQTNRSHQMVVRLLGEDGQLYPLPGAGRRARRAASRPVPTSRSAGRRASRPAPPSRSRSPSTSRRSRSPRDGGTSGGSRSTARPRTTGGSPSRPGAPARSRAAPPAGDQQLIKRPNQVAEARRDRVGSPTRSAPLAQTAERLHGKEKVYGSIP